MFRSALPVNKCRFYSPKMLSIDTFDVPLPRANLSIEFPKRICPEHFESTPGINFLSLQSG